MHHHSCHAQVRLFGRNGCKARVVALHIRHPDTGAELGVLRAKVCHVCCARMMSFRGVCYDCVICCQSFYNSLVCSIEQIDM